TPAPRAPATSTRAKVKSGSLFAEKVKPASGFAEKVKWVSLSSKHDVPRGRALGFGGGGAQLEAGLELAGDRAALDGDAAAERDQRLLLHAQRRAADERELRPRAAKRAHAIVVVERAAGGDRRPVDRARAQRVDFAAERHQRGHLVVRIEPARIGRRAARPQEANRHQRCRALLALAHAAFPRAMVSRALTPGRWEAIVSRGDLLEKLLKIEGFRDACRTAARRCPGSRPST